MTSRRNDESGATMVIVTLSLSALLLIAGLVVDGGRAYASRRHVQNATDSAALAGAQALFDQKYAIATGGLGSGSVVAAAVTAKLTQNRATVSPSCIYVDNTGASLNIACGSSIPTNAAGVRVGASIKDETLFARIDDGPTSLTASSRSTAGILPLVGTSSPFIICGDSNGSWPILNPVVPGQPTTINVANAIAAGVQPVQAAKVGTCGAGDSFKGKTDEDEDLITVEGYAEGQVGNGFEGDVRDQVAGAGLVQCPIPFPEDYTGTCDMLLPIADTGYGNGNDKIFLHIAAWGIFRITGNGSGNPKYYGRFVAPRGVATGGVAGAGQTCVVGTQVCVIKMLS